MKLSKLIPIASTLLVLSCSAVLVAQDKQAGTDTLQIGGADPIAVDLKYLSSDEMRGRETGTPESKIARAFIAKRFAESGIVAFKEGYYQEFSFEDRRKRKFDGANVIGFIEGTTSPDTYIVVSAHYDHLGVQNGQIFNGTDDNASGTVALFSIAGYFRNNPPQHTLVFVAFDAEEKGSPGAKKFLNASPVAISDIVLNVNLDMISRSAKNELYVAGTFHYPEMKPFVSKLVNDAPVKLLFGHDRPELKSDDWTTQSDHRVFHEAKIPFVYFGVEDHEDYHKPTDDFENVDLVFYRKAVDTITKAIGFLDQGLVVNK